MTSSHIAEFKKYKSEHVVSLALNLKPSQKLATYSKVIDYNILIALAELKRSDSMDIATEKNNKHKACSNLNSAIKYIRKYLDLKDEISSQ